MYTDDVIYGKDKDEEIVSIEVKDDNVYTYKNNGEVSIHPMVYKAFSCINLDNKGTKLRGRRHFNHILQFSKREQFAEMRKNYRFKKHTLWSMHNDVETEMVTNGATQFKGLKIDQVSRLGFDIESDGLEKTKESDVYTIANTFKDGEKTVRKVFVRDDFTDTGHMIDAWCDWVRKMNPTMMVAHNGIGYDLPYLAHVAKLYGTALYLGRDASEIKFESYKRNYRVDGSQTWEYNNPHIFGRHIIDTMFLAVKYDIGREFPSWGLKPIIEHLGLVKEGREFYDASKIKDNWENLEERAKIIAYCEDDGDDCLALYDIMCPSFFYMAQSIPKPFQMIINGASGSWINYIMLRAYLQQGKSIPRPSESSKVYGGISFGRPGFHKNVFKIDIKSMYPSIMRQYNVHDPMKDPDAIYASMVDTFTKKRFAEKAKYKETGDKYYDDMQASSKIFINSCYGALGCGGLHFNNYELADFVTGMGRQIIKETINWATGKPLTHWWEDYEEDKDAKYEGTLEVGEYIPRHYVMTNADTDSISFKKSHGGKFSDNEMKNLINSVNSVLPKMIEYEDDGCFEKFVVVKAKNYVMQEVGSDKIKYKGSSFKDSKKEIALKELMFKVIEKSIMEDNEDYIEFYNDCVREAVNIKDINRWCVKKSITKKVFDSERANETKVVDAIKGKGYRVGDKAYVFNAIDGKKQKKLKGELVFLKSGEPSLEENRILRVVEDFNGDYDKMHYVKRVYKTMLILANVIDKEKLVNYGLKKNFTKLVDNS